MHNPSGRTRYAVVNRWAPWWLSVSEFGHPHGNTSSFTAEEFAALPESIQPMFAHLVGGPETETTEVNYNLIQPLNQARSAAAGKRAQQGYYDPSGHSNSHVQVKLRQAAAL